MIGSHLDGWWIARAMVAVTRKGTFVDELGELADRMAAKEARFPRRRAPWENTLPPKGWTPFSNVDRAEAFPFGRDGATKVGRALFYAKTKPRFYTVHPFTWTGEAIKVGIVGISLDLTMRALAYYVHNMGKKS